MLFDQQLKTSIKGDFNMNKGEFVRAIAEKGGFTLKDADIAYTAFVETVKEALKKGDSVALAGFGTYSVKSRAARKGVNPLTGKQITIKAAKVPSFKFGKSFKDTL